MNQFKEQELINDNVMDFEKLSQIKISYEPLSDADTFEKIPESLVHKLPEYIDLTEDGKEKDISTFLELIEQYPDIPTCKNLLYGLYIKLGHFDKAEELNNWVMHEHPEYVFARINKAKSLMSDEQYEKVPQYLGTQMLLSALYPQREIFHISEVLAYVPMVLTYFEGIGEREIAKNLANYLDEVIGDDETYLPTKIFLNAFWERVFYLEDDEIEVFEEDYLDRFDDFLDTAFDERLIQRNLRKLAELNHPEVQSLFLFGAEIPFKILTKIIALPAESLLDDFQLIIDSFFHIKPGFGEQAFEFIHIFTILGEINNPRSVDLQLQLLDADFETNDYYLGDYPFELSWCSLVKHANPNDPRYFDFLIKAKEDIVNQAVIIDVFIALFKQKPELKNDIDNWFIRGLKGFLENGKSGMDVNPRLVAYFIDGVTYLRIVQAIPIISELYKLKYVDEHYCGNLSTVLENIRSKYNNAIKRPARSIKDVYHELIKWQNDDEEDEDEDFIWSNIKQMFMPSQPRIGKKIGRNENCPCGSGKKFKKCCIGLDIWD